MGMSYSDAQRCGIAHLWPDKASTPKLPETAPPPSRFVEDGMTKLERSFWGKLQEAKGDGIFHEVYREPIKLKLAGHTFYTPDFMSFGVMGQTYLWETKGFMRDDAAVKLKVAAAHFPYFRWVLVQKDRGRWRCINVTDRGFSREEYCPDWLS